MHAVVTKNEAGHITRLNEEEMRKAAEKREHVNQAFAAAIASLTERWAKDGTLERLASATAWVSQGLAVARLASSMAEHLVKWNQLLRPVAELMAQTEEAARRWQTILGPTFTWLHELHESLESFDVNAWMLETALAREEELVDVAGQFGCVTPEQLSAFFFVLREGAWRGKRDVRRFIHDAVLYQLRRDRRPLFAARASTKFERISLASSDRLSADSAGNSHHGGAELALLMKQKLALLSAELTRDGDDRIIELKLSGGRSWDEVASILGWSERQKETVKRRFSRLWSRTGFSGEPNSLEELAEWEPVEDEVQ